MLYRIVFAVLLLGAGSASAQVFVSAGHAASIANSVEATTVNLSVNDTPSLNRFTFGSFSGYFPIGPAGTYRFDFRPLDPDLPGATAIQDLPEGSYTVLFAGDGVNRPVEVLIVRDDLDPPAPDFTKLRVLHLAPFAPPGASSEAELLTDGGEFLDRLAYPGVGDYQEIAPGVYDLKFTSQDGNTNFADGSPIELAGGAVTTLALIGDGVTLPFGISSPEFGIVPLENSTDETATGIFFDPNVPGQGIQSIVLPKQDRLLGYVYTFDSIGGNQVWYHFDSCQTLVGEAGCEVPGAFDGISGEVAVYLTSAGIFNVASQQPALLRTGTGTITMLDCDTLLFDGNLGNAAGPVRLTYTRLGDRVSCASELRK